MKKLIFLLAAVAVVAAAYIADATPAAEATTSAAEDGTATLSLTLGTPPTFGAFTPGVARNYESSTTAQVTSTAGDATLTVHDASAVATGHLVNGAFSLPQPLQARATSPAGTGAAYANVGGTASPLTLLTYSSPVSNDQVILGFRQNIGANDALRTGTYAKQLTFTLSTTDGSCSLSLTLVAGRGPSSETTDCSSPPDAVGAETTLAEEATMSVGGTVPATLSLSLGAPASFGAFIPGIARDYQAGTTANVISTAGDALLTVHDASAVATGHLVNGAFSLLQSLQARATSSASTGTAFNNVGGSASPLNLLAWNGPVSNDSVTLEFRQSIGANDALRTGAYAKQLTFTLSTTDGSCSVSVTLVPGSGPSSETVSCASPLATVIAETTPATGATMSVGGSVPATLSLSLGAPASFGAFTPGVAREYLASTIANVISTAGDALLTVHDASSIATGHLVNGAFSLPQSLQARARNAANPGTAFNNVGSTASPLNLLAYLGPVSNDAVTLEFRQGIGATDALRTGTYAKQLTFTLSTTDSPCSLSLTLVAGSGPSSETVSCGSPPDTVIAETTAATEATASVGGSVPATLSLSLGAPASFGAFTPCVTRTYLAGTSANVISTAGDALLTVHDASSIATGHLVNGAFALPQPLQARARNAANPGTAFNNVGSTASPLNLLAYFGPVSNDAVTLEFSQLINAVDALQSGTYAKQLTFTLSTTDPPGSAVSVSLVIGSGPSSGTAGCGPIYHKQAVRTSLLSLLPTGNRDTDKKINEAVSHLTKSLDPTLWADSVHPDPNKGDKVFAEEKAAVKKLMEIKTPSAAISAAIASLLEIDRSLAQTAIDEHAGGNAQKLADAAEEMAKAQADLAKGKFTDAIEHYKNAWKKAIAA